MKEEGGTLLGEKGVRRHQVSSQTRTMLRKKSSKKKQQNKQDNFLYQKKAHTFLKHQKKILNEQ